MSEDDDSTAAAYARRDMLRLGGLAAAVVAVAGGLTTMALGVPQEAEAGSPYGHVIMGTDQTAPVATDPCDDDRLVMYITPNPATAPPR